MKLQDVKEQIDAYFESISAQELFEIVVTKYGITEITSQEKEEGE